MYIFVVFFIFRKQLIELLEYVKEQLQKYLQQNNPQVASPSITVEKEETTPPPSQESLAKKYEKYEKQMRERFVKTFEKTGADAGAGADYNTNVDDIFYDPEKHHYAVLAENNEYEKKWRTRVLIESIPAGSVIMYYDPYKRGFAYFSMQSIPYHVLNAVAMKYVLSFRCRYFFMDETETPVPSKLIDLEKWEPKETKIANSEGIKFVTNSSKDVWTQSKKNVFAKFKSYNTPATKAVEQRKGMQNSVKNRFIYLGNPRYFSILQKIPFPVQAKKKMSYKEFKALKIVSEPNNEVETLCMKLKKHDPEP